MHSGDWQPRTGTDPPPYEGKAMFFAGRCRTAELWQDVQVEHYAAEIAEGKRAFEFSCHVRSYDGDSSRVVINFLSADGKVLSGKYESDELSQTDKWLPIHAKLALPRETRKLRVRLVSRRRHQLNNDGYFDCLSLTLCRL